VGRQGRIFARQNAALVSDELPQQIGVLVIESIHGEINLGLGPGRASFSIGATATVPAALVPIRTCFTRHNGLLDFPVHRATAQSRIILLYFEFFGFEFFVVRGGIARWRLAFLARFRAFDVYDFAGHKLFPYCSFSFGFSSGASSSSLSTSGAPTASTVPSAPNRR